MKTAKIVSLGVAAFAVVNSVASAEQARLGVITEINRLNNTIAIRQIQSGTVGANTGGASEQFKMQNGISLDALHAGDRVSFSVTEAGGTKAVSKIDRQ